MKIKHQFNIEDTHNNGDLITLLNSHKYNFTEEHLSFVKEFPGLSFNGSKLVILPKGNKIGTPLIHNFFSVSDILFVIDDETIMEAFEDIPEEQIGQYSILAFSLTETEIFLLGTEEGNKGNVYVYSSITDETVIICNGLENFINNFLNSA